MTVFGGIVVVSMAIMGVYTLVNELPKLML